MLDSHIWTTKFAQAAVPAFFRVLHDGLFMVIEFQDLSWAESDANPATLTPFPVDDLFLLFEFGHLLI